MRHEFLFQLPLANLPYLLGGALLTLQLAVVATIGGLLIAIVIAWIRYLRLPILTQLAGAYVELMRNTPVLVQLFFGYFALPSAGINLDPTSTAILVFTLNNSAYMAEIIRGGLASVGRGVVDAGLSLAMSRTQTFRYVILPPAIRNVAPALANQFIALTLATSLASQIAAEELTYRATLLEARIFHSFEIYAIILVMYFILAQILMRILDLLLRKTLRRSPQRTIPQL